MTLLNTMDRILYESQRQVRGQAGAGWGHPRYLPVLVFKERTKEGVVWASSQWCPESPWGSPGMLEECVKEHLKIPAVCTAEKSSTSAQSQS